MRSFNQKKACVTRDLTTKHLPTTHSRSCSLSVRNPRRGWDSNPRGQSPLD